MKHIIRIFLLALLCANVFAQTDPLRTRLNSIFANVNKSQVPTGFLQEFATPLLPLGVFNGVLTDSNKVDLRAWRMLYATLQSSRIYGTNPLPVLSTVNATVTTYQNTYPGLFVMPMLYADCNYIRPDAVAAHLLTVSGGQIFDVAGRTQSPYYAAKVFAATPSVGYADTGTPSFIFNSDLFYNASTRLLSSINIDFGDGRGYLTAAWNTPITAAYMAAGTYNIKVKIIFTDNSYVECYSPFQVTQISVVAQQPLQQGSFATYQSFAPTASHSGGTAWFKYSSTRSTGVITKPLIVVKGYDLSDVAPGLQAHYTFDNFKLDIVKESAPYDLSGNLDLAGYDIVFVDYNRGTDDIVRNAALLQDVISWVNGQKASVNSTEKNIVMGISMGGLVARYCLASMTKQSQDHQTTLLLTNDSPHQGANVPLGLQFLVRAISETNVVQSVSQGLTITGIDVVSLIDQAVAALNAPASQQMLILAATNGTGGYAANTWLNTTYRNMITFPSSGPQPTYKTEAISLGSECGVSSLAPSSNLFSVTGNFFVSPFPWIKKSSYNTNISARALPVFGSSQNIMTLHIWYNYSILGGLISINADVTNKTAGSPANTFPWDGVPGGVLSVASEINFHAPTPQVSWMPFFNATQTQTVASAFSFVPVVSALDITTINSNAFSASYVGGVSPTNPARVANFIAEGKYDDPSGNLYNGAHAELTPRNAKWFFQEIVPPINGANTVNCSNDCVTSFNGLLNGPTLVCTTGSFQINNLPSGHSVVWASSNQSALALISSQGSNPASFQRVANANVSAVTVSASLSGSCGTSGQTFPIVRVGTYNHSDYSIIESRNALPGGGTQYQYGLGSWMVNDATATYNWSWRNYTYVSGQGTRVVTLKPIGTSGGYVGLSIGNACGWSDPNPMQFFPYVASYAVMASPVPASSTLTVQVVDSTATNSGQLPHTYDVKLYNRLSQLVYTTQSSDKSIQIPTGNLPEDIYYLNVFYRDAVLQKQIVVKK